MQENPCYFVVVKSKKILTTFLAIELAIEKFSTLSYLIMELKNFIPKTTLFLILEEGLLFRKTDKNLNRGVCVCACTHPHVCMYMPTHGMYVHVCINVYYSYTM